MQRNKGKRQGTIESRVRCGAEWLDRVRPDWYKEINLGWLRLSHSCNCVLGQIVLKEGRKAQRHDIEEARFAWGYGSVVTSMQLIDVQKERLSRVDNLKALVIPNVTAKRRGFELTTSQDHDEWNALTEEWKRVIEVRRGLDSLER